MAVMVDLEQLDRVFGRKGERVVLVLPTGGAVVLVPLSEYEELVRSDRHPAKVNPGTPAPQAARRNPSRQPVPPKQAPVASPQGDLLEAVDPLQGGLADDDQYFPEPLE